MQKPTGGEPRPEDARQTDREQALASSPLHRLTSRATRAARGWAGTRTAAVERHRGVVAPPVHLRRARPPDRRRIDRGGRSAPRVPPHDAPGRRQRHPGLDRRARLAVGGSERDRRRDTIDDTGVDGRRRGVGIRRHELHAGLAAGRCAERPGRRAVGRRRAGDAPAAVVAPVATDEPETAVQDDGTLISGLRPRDDRRGRRRPHPDVQGPEGRHAGGRREEVRRLDDDPVVGEQAQEGRPQVGPDPANPAGHGRRVHGQATRTRSTTVAEKLQGQRLEDRRR